MRTLKEFLIETLMETSIFEMAENQSKCEDNVKSQCKNILENLILLNYFKVSELYTTNISHWKNELCTSIFNAGDFQVKKDKSVKRRERIVKRAFDDRDMYDAYMLAHRIERKMDLEKEAQYNSNPKSKEWLGEAIAMALNQLQDVEALIVFNSWKEIKQWTNKVFDK